MKLSEKITQAMLEGQVRDFSDAYQGAMEEVAIWKRRALEAEDLNRKFIAEINGPTHMGEPVQNGPSVPDGVVEALQRLIENGAVLGSASAEDALLVARYRQRLLACAPSIPEGWKLVPIEPTPGMMRGAHRLVAAARRVLASADSQGLIRLDESGDVASELRSALEAAPEAKP